MKHKWTVDTNTAHEQSAPARLVQYIASPYVPSINIVKADDSSSIISLNSLSHIKYTPLDFPLCIFFLSTVQVCDNREQRYFEENQ